MCWDCSYDIFGEVDDKNKVASRCQQLPDQMLLLKNIYQQSIKFILV